MQTQTKTAGKTAKELHEFHVGCNGSIIWIGNNGRDMEEICTKCKRYITKRSETYFKEVKAE